MPLHLKGNKKLYSVSELISEESLLSSGPTNVSPVRSPGLLSSICLPLGRVNMIDSAVYKLSINAARFSRSVFLSHQLLGAKLFNLALSPAWKDSMRTRAQAGFSLPRRQHWRTGGGSPCHTDLVLNVFITQLQLHDALKGPEERFVEMEVRRLTPVCENLRQDVVDEGNSLLRHMALLVAGGLHKTRES